LINNSTLTSIKLAVIEVRFIFQNSVIEVQYRPGSDRQPRVPHAPILSEVIICGYEVLSVLINEFILGGDVDILPTEHVKAVPHVPPTYIILVPRTLPEKVLVVVVVVRINVVLGVSEAMDIGDGLLVHADPLELPKPLIRGLVHQKILALDKDEEGKRDHEEGGDEQDGDEGGLVGNLDLVIAQVEDVGGEEVGAALEGLHVLRVVKGDVNVCEAEDVDEDEVELQGHDEEEEKGMVPYPHTVIDPLAVVVEPFDAFVADVAVAGLDGADDLAGGAEHIGVELLHQLQKAHLVRLLQEPRVLHPRQHKEHVHQTEPPHHHHRPHLRQHIGEDEEEHARDGDDHQEDVDDEGPQTLVQLGERLLHMGQVALGRLLAHEPFELAFEFDVDDVELFDDIYGLPAEVVGGVPVGALDQQLLDGPGVRKVLRRLYGEMERSVAEVVLGVDVQVPGQQVINSSI